MTNIYFAGGEDSSFTLVGSSIGTTTASAAYRTAFARYAIGIPGNLASATLPPTNYLLTPLLGSMTSFWVHFQFGSSGFTGSPSANQPLFWLNDSSGVTRFLVRGTATAGQVKLSTRNAAGTLTDLVTSAANIYPGNLGTVPFAVDLFVNYAASGQATLYFNGAVVADTGPGVNITTDGATSLAQLGLQSLIFNVGVGGVAGFSEVLVQDTPTLGCALATLAPQATGTTQAWTGAVATVNKLTINDTTFASTAGNNLLSEWTIPTSLPTGLWTVEAIVQEARISIGTSGPMHFDWVCRTADGTDNLAGTNTAATTVFANYTHQWPVNPHTAAAWAQSDITTGVNLGLESLA